MQNKYSINVKVNFVSSFRIRYAYRLNVIHTLNMRIFSFILNLFVSVVQQPTSGLNILVVEVSRSHTTVTNTQSPVNERSARRKGRYLHNTQQTHDTNIYTLSGIQNRDPRNRAASDPRLRPQGHRDFINNFFPHGAIDPKGPGPPHCRGFTITLRHTTLGRTPLYE